MEFSIIELETITINGMIWVPCLYALCIYYASTSGLCLANTQSGHQNISYDD